MKLISVSHKSTLGGVIVGSGLSVSSGTLSLDSPKSASLVGTDANGVLVDKSGSVVSKVGSFVTNGSIERFAPTSSGKTVYTVSGTKWFTITLECNGSTGSSCGVYAGDVLIAKYERLYDGFAPISFSGPIKDVTIKIKLIGGTVSAVTGFWCVNDVG